MCSYMELRNSVIFKALPYHGGNQYQSSILVQKKVDLMYNNVHVVILNSNCVSLLQISINILTAHRESHLHDRGDLFGNFSPIQLCMAAISSSGTCKPNQTFVVRWAGVLRKIVMYSNVGFFSCHAVDSQLVERCTFCLISGSIPLINWHHVDELPFDMSSVNEIDVEGRFCKAAI